MDNQNGNHEQIPNNDDLENVRRLAEYASLLREQLIQCEEQLKVAWSKIPYDPEVNKKPWQSDIPARCRNCNKPTKWVSPKGYSMHYIRRDNTLVMECPPDRLGKTTEGISQDIWDILDMPDEDFGPDGDETLEVIRKRPSRPVEVRDNKEVKPSEREN